jgi:hypothetical protein
MKLYMSRNLQGIAVRWLPQSPGRAPCITGTARCRGRVCERILRAPTPLVYTRHTSRFLLAWCLLLPLGLYTVGPSDSLSLRPSIRPFVPLSLSFAPNHFLICMHPQELRGWIAAPIFHLVLKMMVEQFLPRTNMACHRSSRAAGSWCPSPWACPPSSSALRCFRVEPRRLNGEASNAAARVSPSRTPIHLP